MSILFGPVSSAPAKPETAQKIAASAGRLESNVKKIVESFGPRDSVHPGNLKKIAAFIRQELESLNLQVREQVFVADKHEYANVLAELGPDTEEMIIVGAHYDTAGPFPGADDNASGVAGILELAQLLVQSPPNLKVILVAYCLEEPPYFRTPLMGSAIHAAELKKKKAKVRLMLSLDMIGYFSDQTDSQRYPIPALGKIYPKIGNFIAVVSTTQHLELTNHIKNAMAASTPLPVYSMNAPPLLPGIDFSDHLNFLNAGYPGIMITDTADYRNVEYHSPRDTPDRLDYKRMAQVVDGLLAAVRATATSPATSSATSPATSPAVERTTK